MRKMLRSAVLAGAALAAAGTAVAGTQASRVMTVGLPDGSVARIEYQGEVAPRVTVTPVLRFVPVRQAEAELVSPFALFDRIAADMDRQMAVMMRQARMMEAAAAQGTGPDRVQLVGMPAGAVSYYFISTNSGGGTCSRGIQMTSLGPDQQPRVVSSSSGDCGPAARQPVPAAGTPARRAPSPDTI